VSILSPAAQHHAEVREELDTIGRVFMVHRFLRWSARGLAVGLTVTLAWIVALWLREAVTTAPAWLFVVPPLGLAALVGGLTLTRREKTERLAYRVDNAAGLQERVVTALQLGAEGADHPLAVAQLRDAAEHLKRLDAVETFPFRVPKVEIIAAAFLTLGALMVYFAPNPFAIRGRADSLAAAVARDQATRVSSLAESVVADTRELQELRDLLRSGAKTIETRSADPESALSSLEDLEERLRQMSAQDDELRAALAAISSALGGESVTNRLASAINTGDLREVGRAARDLGSALEGLQGDDRARLEEVLRDAAQRAGRSSPAVSGALSEAAQAMSQQGQQQGGQQGSGSQQGQGNGDASASQAMNELGRSAEAAGERSRAQGQLESSRNALERALGRTESRSGAGTPSRSRAQSGSSLGAEAGEGMGEGEGSGMGEGEGSDGGSGSGTGSGDPSLAATGMDFEMMLRDEMMGGGLVPDYSSEDPFLSGAESGSMQAGAENVSGQFARRSSQGGDSNSIPLGLRDLVKDYFSSINQDQP
jgi:hypothetical protein